jgi:hypothetical protein
MIKKILLWLSLITVLVVTGTYTFLYVWFHNNEDLVLNSAQKDWLTTVISESPDLPDNVYLTMEKYYPNFYSDNTWNYKLKSLAGFTRRKCQCNEIYLPYIPGDSKQWNDERPWIPFDQKDVLVKLYIEKHFTQKECFTFNMNFSKFGGNTLGIFEASKYFYNKELAELTEREVIGLYVILKAPAHLNPINNPKNHKRAVDAVMLRKQ